MNIDARIEIRPLRLDERADWEPLWRGYLDFYKTSVPQQTYDTTWARLHDPDEPMWLLGATVDGKLLGIVHYLYHRSCWTVGDYCYLQDLFVAEEARKLGLGRALIEAVYQRGEGGRREPRALAHPRDQCDGASALRHAGGPAGIYSVPQGVLTLACATGPIWEDAGKHKNNGQGRRECLSRGDTCWRERRRHWRPMPALAQEANWPQRPLRIIIPTAPGGSPDIASRLIGDKITGRLGQSIVVESMTTGGGVAGLQMVAKSAPDGYTLAMLTGGFATQAAVLKNLQYEPLKDFVFITSVVRYPMVYTVRPDSADQELQGHDRPRQGQSRQDQLRHRRRRQRLSSARQVDRQCRGRRDERGAVSRHGAGPAGCARRARRCAQRCRDQHHSSRSERPAPGARGVLGRALSAAAGVPTMAATVPGIKVESWLGLAATASTPRPIVERLNSEFRRALELPEVKKWAEESGVVPAPSTPEEFRARVESDVRQWTEIVVRNNISIQ